MNLLSCLLRDPGHGNLRGDDWKEQSVWTVFWYWTFCLGLWTYYMMFHIKIVDKCTLFLTALHILAILICVFCCPQTHISRLPPGTVPGQSLAIEGGVCRLMGVVEWTPFSSKHFSCVCASSAIPTHKLNTCTHVHTHTCTAPSPPHSLYDARGNKLSLFEQVFRKESGALAST